MRLSLPYGTGTCEADLDWGQCLGVLNISDTSPITDVQESARQAIEHPIGLQGNLETLLYPGDSVAIVVSDSFRNTGVEQILPVLLKALARARIREEDIQFFFASGSHRPPTAGEQQRILGESVYEQYRDQLHLHTPGDPDNLSFAGTTSRGTPVFVNKRARACTHIILTGAVVLHYFGGFGGGRKSVVPGLASLETIARNHSLNLHPVRPELNPDVRIGVLDGNPVAMDMLEGARLCGVRFIINTVLDREQRIAGIFAGELDAAHRAAADFARQLFAIPIAKKADLVIASAGSAKNFIQSHKALFNAWQALAPNGRIVFLCPAAEGFGGDKFVQWLALGSRESIIEELRKNAEINGQTALSTLEKAPKCVMLTGLSASDTAKLGARRAETLEEALNIARAELAAEGCVDPSYYVMPSASYTVPMLEEE